MANTKSAQKAYRQSERRRVVNNERRSALKTSVKKLRVALEQPQSADQLEAMLRVLAAQLARAKSKKIMKKNTASRVLSRLAKRVASVQKEASV